MPSAEIKRPKDYVKSLTFMDLVRKRKELLALSINKELAVQDFENLGTWQTIMPLADMYLSFGRRDVEGVQAIREVRQLGIEWATQRAAEIMAKHENSVHVRDCPGRTYAKYLKFTSITKNQLEVHFGTQEVAAGLHEVTVFRDALDAEEIVIGCFRYQPIDRGWNFFRDKQPTALVRAENNWMHCLDQADFIPRNRAHLRVLIERCSPGTVRPEYVSQLKAQLSSLEASAAIDELLGHPTARDFNATKIKSVSCQSHAQNMTTIASIAILASDRDRVNQSVYGTGRALPDQHL